MGGPIKKDRAFFFANVEAQRERKEDSVVRIVPSLLLRQGTIQYLNTSGGTTALSSTQIKSMDPQGLGPNPVVLNFFQSYPQPNDNSVGDGLNYTGYRFAAAAPNNLYAYTARFDYVLTASGSQNLFWRGNLQNDLVDDVPYLLGQSPLHLDEDYSKGFVLGHTANLRPNLINSFRWGLTRQSHATLGDSTQPWIIFRLLNESPESRNFTRSRQWTLPVHNLVDDLSWVKAATRSHSASIRASFATSVSAPQTLSAMAPPMPPGCPLGASPIKAFRSIRLLPASPPLILGSTLLMTRRLSPCWAL